MDEAASILIVSPTTPSSKSVMAVVPAVMNDCYSDIDGVASPPVKVTAGREDLLGIRMSVSV
jgi:hypothetical protein